MGFLDSDYVGSGTTTTTYNVPVPTGLQENDLIFVQMVTNTSVADTVTPPDANWHVIVASAVTGSVGFAWYYHFVTAAEAASPPSSWTFTLSTARTGNFIYQRFRGWTPTAPFENKNGSGPTADVSLAESHVYPTGTITTTVPGVTTSQADCVLVGGANLQSATTESVSVPTGWTSDKTTCLLTLGRGQVAGHLALTASGATGNQVFNKTLALAGSGFMLALVPESTATENLSGTGTLADTAALTSTGVGGIVDSGADFSVDHGAAGAMNATSLEPDNTTAKAGSWQHVGGDFNLVSLLTDATDPKSTFTAPA